MTKAIVYKLGELRESVYKEMLEMLDKFGRCHLTCATGFGKSWIFKRYVKEHPNKKILIITDRINVRDDLNNLIKWNPNNIAVTYAYLAREKTFEQKLDFLRKFDVMIFDESHLMGSHNCDRVVEIAKESGIILIGGSATPLRSDGNNVSKTLFGGHEISYTIKQALRDGFIKKPHFETVHYLKVRINKTRQGLEYKKGAKWAISQLTKMERAIACRDSLKIAIANAVNISGKGIYIVFHPNVAALELMRDEIDEAFKQFSGVKCYTVTSRKEHLDVMEFQQLHEDFSVVHSVDMLTTGYHFSDIAGIIFNSVTDSPIKFGQQAGRGIELGSDRVVSFVDLAGRLSYRSNAFIQDTFGFKKKKKGMGGGLRPEAQVYEIENELLEVDFEYVLDAIDTWSGKQFNATEDDIVQARRLTSYTLGSAHKASGIPVESIKEIWQSEGLWGDSKGGILDE